MGALPVVHVAAVRQWTELSLVASTRRQPPPLRACWPRPCKAGRRKGAVSLIFFCWLVAFASTLAVATASTLVEASVPEVFQGELVQHVETGFFDIQGLPVGRGNNSLVHVASRGADLSASAWLNCSSLSQVNPVVVYLLAARHDGPRTTTTKPPFPSVLCDKNDTNTSGRLTKATGYESAFSVSVFCHSGETPALTNGTARFGRHRLSAGNWSFALAVCSSRFVAESVEPGTSARYNLTVVDTKWSKLQYEVQLRSSAINATNASAGNAINASGVEDASSIATHTFASTTTWPWWVGSSVAVFLAIALLVWIRTRCSRRYSREVPLCDIECEDFDVSPNPLGGAWRADEDEVIAGPLAGRRNAAASPRTSTETSIAKAENSYKPLATPR